MKKILYILFAIGVIVSSCSKNLDTDWGDGEVVAASFTNSTITRATDEVWATNDQIGIFAYDETSAIYNNYENIPYKTESGGSSATFTPSDATQILFPKDNSALSFLAYSPYQESSNDGVYDIDVADQSDPTLIDLIVSNDGVGYSGTNPTAPLTFAHKMAKFTMILEAGDGLTATDLKGATISFSYIITKGTYDFSTDTFKMSSTGTMSPRTVVDGEEYAAIIMPYLYTSSTRIYVYITLTNGKQYYWNATGEEFTSGKDHAYTVTVSESEISVSTANLSSWGANDSETLTAEKA